MKFLYNIFIYCYPLLAKLISFKNKKANLWVEGRKNIFVELQKAFANNKTPVIWMHCSSLGEFEQGKPILEKLKKKYTNYKILLTFFSPSGYEIRKNYEGVNWVFYLPMDSPSNAKKFLVLVKPQLIIFVKYEFWNYYLQQAKYLNIPLLIVSAVFRGNQIFFKSYGSFHRKMLTCFTHFFVQNLESKQLLNSIHMSNNITIAGDTRFDRVIEIAKNYEPILTIEKFIGNKPVIVAGSTWEEDEKILAHFINTQKHIQFIIAPHNIDEASLATCKKYFKYSIFLSEYENLNEPINNTNNCLIIDNVGMLSKLYKYATICYVGGAFGNDGVHNVLEAAVYYKPVVFGPEYEKYNEAKELIIANGAFSVNSALALEEVFEELLNNENEWKTCSKQAGDYVYENAGATEKIMKYIQEKRLLTN